MPEDAAASSGASPQQDQVRWSFFSRLAFRFAFCYLALYCLDAWDQTHVLYAYLAAKRSSNSLPDIFLAPVWHRLVPWVGKHVLHLATPITVFSNGSGDTRYDYVVVLCLVSFSTLAALAWSFLDHHRPNYQTLHQWLRLAVILTLAEEMLTYGFDKAFPLQFGTLNFSRLSEPLGEMSPVMLLWNFMAASKPYTIAVGLVEVVGGVLLLIPRFTTLGALVCLASMANVFALNMSYDVPVKLASFHYLLLACFLLLPEVSRLLKVFVWNRPAAPVIHVPYSSRAWVCRSALVFRVVVGLLLFSSLAYLCHRAYVAREAERTAAIPLYGVWSVDEFAVRGNSATLLFTPKLLQDLKIPAWKDRWERLIFQSRELAFIQLSNGALDRVTPKVDLKNNSLLFVDPDDPTWQCALSVQAPDAHSLRLQGSVNGLAVAAKLHRQDETRFILLTRGFRWISEYPYYR